MRHPINGTSHQLGGWLAVFPSFLDPYEFPALPSLSSSTYPCVIRLSSLRLFVESFSFFFFSFLFLSTTIFKPWIAKPKHFHLWPDRSLCHHYRESILFYFTFFLFFFLFPYFSFPFFKVLILVVGWQFMQELSQWRSATSTALVQSSRVHVQKDGARQSLPGSSFEVATWGGGVEKKKGLRVPDKWLNDDKGGKGVRTKTRKWVWWLEIVRWPKQQEVNDGISTVLSFATPSSSSRVSQLASIQKSKKMRRERGRIGTTSMKTRVNLCMYVCTFFLIYDYMNQRIERMPGYVSIQTFTPTLILVSYATTHWATAEWLQSNTEPIIKYRWNTPYHRVQTDKRSKKVS